jgi:tRNA U34 5-carboxymethylaminomethyl modifying GTPase MnmE/TrmE
MAPESDFQLTCGKSLKVVNKIDLVEPEDLPKYPDFIYISLKSSEGLELLSSKLLSEVKYLCQSKVMSSSLCLTRERHKNHLKVRIY